MGLRRCLDSGGAGLDRQDRLPASSARAVRMHEGHGRLMPSMNSVMMRVCGSSTRKLRYPRDRDSASLPDVIRREAQAPVAPVRSQNCSVPPDWNTQATEPAELAQFLFG